MRGAWAILLFGLTLVGMGVGAAAAQAGLVPAAPLPLGQARYTESCGGCHGILGTSSGSDIPELRDQVGAFLCSEEGRSYIVRLPNVAFAAMDDRALASTMNFVVFGLGGASVPRNARSYSAKEVARLRRAPLKSTDLQTRRMAVLARALEACPRRQS